MEADLDERAIFVSGPVVVFKWRNVAGWPVDYVSPNANEVFGYTAAAFQSGEVPYAEIILAEDAARVASEVTAASEAGVPSFVHEPYRVRHRDGRARWLYDFTHVLRDDAGVVRHFLGYVIDITARMEAEEQARELERRLLHAQKLESLGVLAGGVAHDFNNLLTGILGQTSLARRRLELATAAKGDAEAANPSGTVVAAGAIEQIEKLARSAADLTRQLLAYSGRGSFVVEPLDLGAQLQDIVDMLGVAVPRNAELVLELGEDVPPIEGDRAQIQQIAMNLLTNAGEALGGAPGRVTLTTSVVVRTAHTARDEGGAEELAPGTYVLLQVADTGCGMTDEVRSRLFDPFFTTKGAGRGLGMSAVQGIVRGHKGAMGVTSVPGRGTTFRVLFPARGDRPVSSPRPPVVPASRERGGTILVVDDQANLRATLRALLTDLGYDVLLAPEGGEALRVLEANRGAVVAVLLDLTMPGMSGPETLDALRLRAPGLPVILTSGFSAKESAAARNADAFLQKPFGEEELSRALARALPRG
jgi:two-component system cell cycle sensor histidine kinase/response regulator CckA